MKIATLVTAPSGLRAYYAVEFMDGNERKLSIADQLVDMVAILELDADDIRRGGPRERFGAERGRKDKICGYVFEGADKPSPVSDATEVYRRMYGSRFIRAAFLGYSRDDEEPGRATDAYWGMKAQEAFRTQG